MDTKRIDSMKVCLLMEPCMSGVFTVYRILRKNIKSHGVEFRWVIPAWPDASHTMINDFDGHEYVTDMPCNEKDLAMHTLNHIVEHGYDLVMVYPNLNPAQLNIVRYLPKHIRCVCWIHNITSFLYNTTKQVISHLDAIVVVCRRIQDDLIKYHSMPKSKINLIWNGIDIESFYCTGKSRDKCIKAVFIGRITDYDKAVLILPDIILRAKRMGLEVKLNVIGTGPDENLLLRKILSYKLDHNIKLCGLIPAEKIPIILSESDVLLLPSRFEACPMVILEAMASGCIPIASLLYGATDGIITDRDDGFLVKPGDVKGFVSALQKISNATNHELDIMRRHGINKVNNCFSDNIMTELYYKLFEKLIVEPSRRVEPVDINNFTILPYKEKKWRSLIPVKAKKIIRTYSERFGFGI